MTLVARAAGRWLAGSAIALGLAVALGWLPTRRWGGGGATEALWAGCAVAFAGALAGAMPVLAALARPGSSRPQAVAGWSMALRAGATLAGALVGALGTSVERPTFLIWVAAAYAALLIAETRWTIRWLAAGGE